MFAPEEALHLGYIDRVVDPTLLDETVEAEITRLRGLDIPSYVATKARVNEHAITAIRAAIDDEMPSAVRGRAAAS